MRIRPEVAQDFAGAPLVESVSVGVQEGDGQRLNVLPPEPFCRRRDLVLPERLENRPGGIQPLRDLLPPLPWDEWGCPGILPW
jgi:hypothetical protein